jgi:hypothetical protein
MRSPSLVVAAPTPVTWSRVWHIPPGCIDGQRTRCELRARYAKAAGGIAVAHFRVG